MSSAPRGLAPREGLEHVLMKMGRTGTLLEPHCRPQAGKSGYPRSQNADMRHVYVLLMFFAYLVGGAPWAALSPSRSGLTQWQLLFQHLP